MIIKDIVKVELTQYETDNNIIIEFAALSGSRDFGYFKATSDYDIGFVYKGNQLQNMPLKDTHNGSVISYKGFLHEHFTLGLDSSDYYTWNLFSSRYIIIDNDYKSPTIADHPYNRDQLLKMMYWQALTFYKDGISPNEITTSKLYLSTLNALKRMRWLDENDNLDFPPELLYYLDNSTLEEATTMLNSSDLNTERINSLDTHIIKELDVIRKRYNL